MVFCIAKRFLTISFHKNTKISTHWSQKGPYFVFSDQTFGPNFPLCPPPEIVKISMMLIERVNLLLRKKNLWASDSVNRHSTSKCEILYSFFTRIDSGRIFARLLFHFQKWLGCENQQAHTKPTIYSYLINFSCYWIKQAKTQGSKPHTFLSPEKMGIF